MEPVKGETHFKVVKYCVIIRSIAYMKSGKLLEQVGIIYKKIRKIILSEKY